MTYNSLINRDILYLYDLYLFFILWLSPSLAQHGQVKAGQVRRIIKNKYLIPGRVKVRLGPVCQKVCSLHTKSLK